MKKANWQEYNKEIRKRLPLIRKLQETNNKEIVDQIITSIHDKIIEITNTNIPTMKYNKKKQHCWNSELEIEKNKCKKLRKEYYAKRNTNRLTEEIISAKERYKNETKEYKKALKKARIKAFRIFCYEQSKDDPWGAA